LNEIWLVPCGARSDKVLLLTNDERFGLLNKLVGKWGEEKQSMIKVVDEEIILSNEQKRMV
jgi:hypothetical protein